MWPFNLTKVDISIIEKLENGLLGFIKKWIEVPYRLTNTGLYDFIKSKQKECLRYVIAWKDVVALLPMG